MNKLLEIDRVTKVYSGGPQGFTALSDVSCSFESGEYTAVIGPSGAGKSTLLHIAGGLEPPTRGKVRSRGADIYAMRDSRIARWRNRQVGFVFQFYHLIEELTVAENVALPYFLSTGRGKTAFKKASEVLEYLEIKDKKNSFPSQLSGGQRQKAAIARALINDPEIIFCDEPTGNLDKDSADKVLELLSFLNRDKNMTVVIVTHNPEIAAGAKRVLRLCDGELVPG